MLCGSGQDEIWLGPLNRWLAAISPRTGTPWVATAIVAIAGVVLCLTVSLSELIKLTGATLVLSYAIVAFGALVGRWTGATDHSPYKTPCWPLPPIFAIAALVYITTQQTDTALTVTGVTMLVGLAYWGVLIVPRRDRAFTVKDPAFDTEEA